MPPSPGVLPGPSVKKAPWGLFYDKSTNPIQKNETLMTPLPPKGLTSYHTGDEILAYRF